MDPVENALVEAYLPIAGQLEGNSPTMYLDTEGYVTVGEGRMLPIVEDAQKLPFMAFGRAASAKEIAAEYARVKAMPRGMLARKYARIDSPWLTNEERAAMLREDVESRVKELGWRMAAYKTIRFSWRLALLDIAFNVGVHGLLTGWPHLMEGVESGNAEICAKECVRPQLSQERNEWTQRQFLLGIAQNQGIAFGFPSKN